jgi:hypothetical protein
MDRGDFPNEQRHPRPGTCRASGRNAQRVSSWGLTENLAYAGKSSVAGGFEDGEAVAYDISASSSVAGGEHQWAKPPRAGDLPQVYVDATVVSTETLLHMQTEQAMAVQGDDQRQHRTVLRVCSGIRHDGLAHHGGGASGIRDAHAPRHLRGFREQAWPRPHGSPRRCPLLGGRDRRHVP